MSHDNWWLQLLAKSASAGRETENGSNLPNSQHNEIQLSVWLLGRSEDCPVDHASVGRHTRPFALQCVRQLFHLAVVEIVIETAVAALLCYEIAEAGKLTASIDQAHTG